VNNHSDNEVSSCIKCCEYESQLRVALDELSSVKLINKLLQKEVLAYTTHKSTWKIDRVYSARTVEPMEQNGWTLVTDKSRTRVKNTSAKFNQPIQITNRYTPLNDMPTGNEGNNAVSKKWFYENGKETIS